MREKAREREGDANIEANTLIIQPLFRSVLICTIHPEKEEKERKRERESDRETAKRQRQKVRERVSVKE